MARLFRLQAERADNPSELGSMVASIIAMVRSLPPAGAGAHASAVTPATASFAGLSLERGGSESAAVAVPPDGAFDVEVAPGEGVQAAIDRCPPGGCVLLLPGTHAGPLVLAANKVVHVFGRSQATLQTVGGEVVTSAANKATIDGLIVRTEAHASGKGHHGILITAGNLRVQNCNVSNQSRSGICVTGPAADPFIVDCCLHHCAQAGISLNEGCRGTVKGCT